MSEQNEQQRIEEIVRELVDTGIRHLPPKVESAEPAQVCVFGPDSPEVNQMDEIEQAGFDDLVRRVNATLAGGSRSIHEVVTERQIEHLVERIKVAGWRYYYSVCFETDIPGMVKLNLYVSKPAV